MDDNMEALQHRLSVAVDGCNELGRIAADLALQASSAVAESARLIGAYEMAAESRELWKKRAISAGWFPIVSLDELQRVKAAEQEPWRPTIPEGLGRATLAEAVGQAIGTASMCWGHVDRAGVFDDRLAASVQEGLMAWLSDYADEIRREANAKAAQEFGHYDEDDPSLDKQALTDTISAMQNKGVLFRERTPDPQ